MRDLFTKIAGKWLPDNRALALSSCGRMAAVLIGGGMLSLTACTTSGGWSSRFVVPAGREARSICMEVTGYCDCGLCCGWRRNWFGMPVYSSGPLAGVKKEIGMTAIGARAIRGTIAADTSVLPFYTIVNVPGYGYGRVEDRGGDIRGNRLDLFFPSHREAQKWGRKKIWVTVWTPRGTKPPGSRAVSGIQPSSVPASAPSPRFDRYRHAP